MRLMFFLLLFMLSASAQANSVYRLFSESPGKSPFEILEEAYNRGGPARLVDLMEGYGTGCIDSYRTLNYEVTKSTKLDQIVPSHGSVYVHYYQEKLQDATPGRGEVGRGPLFPPAPAIPDTPAKYKTFFIIIPSWTCDIRSADLDRAVKKFVKDNDYLLTQTDSGIVELVNSNYGDYRLTRTYRKIEDIIVIKTESRPTDTKTRAGNTQVEIRYNYIWQEEK